MVNSKKKHPEIGQILLFEFYSDQEGWYQGTQSGFLYDIMNVAFFPMKSGKSGFFQYQFR